MASLILLAGTLSTWFGLGGTLFGFGTGGIIAGSAAAAAQAAIGNVAAGSLFATMTSLGMQGVLAGAAIGGGVATAVGAALS